MEHDALIPYPHNQEIVLRHRDSIVVYDPASKQLVVRNDPQEDADLTDRCPYCRRPFHEASPVEQEADGPGPSGPVTAPFASPEYFQMLNHSLPSSEHASRASSPRRRLMHRLRSGGAETPDQAPPGSEFVGSSPAPTQHGISATAFSPNYFNRFFIEEKELGRGGKGVVLLVRHVLDGVSLGHFALKRIPVGDDHKWLEKVLVEVQLLQHLSHQNLVSYRHVWLEDVQINSFGPSVPCAFVLQQYCNEGDLHNYVLGGMKAETSKEHLKQRLRRRSKADHEVPDGAKPRRLQFEEIRSFFKDITAGLTHLHVNNYVHRDLKPSNCLLHRHGSHTRVLVSDFGEVQSETQMRTSTGATGTISYCAPEVLQQDSATGIFGNFTTKSDIFSLGMILYFLCFAKLPYQHADVLNEETEDMDSLKEEIRKWAGIEGDIDLSSDLPDKLYRFLRRLLALDPNERPTAEETLYGIKTGSTLDDTSDNWPRAGGQGYGTARRMSRISSVDTPPDSSPVRAPHTQKRSIRSEPPERLHATALRNNTGKDTSIPNEVESGSEEERSPTSLVLHSGRTPPLKMQELLPQPEYSRWHLLRDVDTQHTFKLVGLLLKVVSVYLPCLPVATQPFVGLSLLGLAFLDLVIDVGVALSIALLVAHISILFGAQYGNMLCLPNEHLLNDVEI